MRQLSRILPAVVCGLSVVLAVGCSSLKTPATADVAVTTEALESATDAGASQFAPIEMNAARDKLALARQALARKDYPLAISLADQSKADAKLAQGMANSAKARADADALQQDIQVLRDEINRK